jgi:hypothetical protein
MIAVVQDQRAFAISEARAAPSPSTRPSSAPELSSRIVV